MNKITPDKEPDYPTDRELDLASCCLIWRKTGKRKWSVNTEIFNLHLFSEIFECFQNLFHIIRSILPSFFFFFILNATNHLMHSWILFGFILSSVLRIRLILFENTFFFLLISIQLEYVYVQQNQGTSCLSLVSLIRKSNYARRECLLWLTIYRENH